MFGGFFIFKPPLPNTLEASRVFEASARFGDSKDLPAALIGVQMGPTLADFDRPDIPPGFRWQPNGMVAHARCTTTMEENMKHIHDVSDSELIADLSAELEKATDPEDVEALNTLITRTKARRERLTLRPDSPLCREAPRRYRPTVVILNGFLLTKVNGRIFVQHGTFISKGVILND
jgi:hypothetical protein